MSFVRRFLLAPALARLVRKQRGAALVTEGFLFSEQDRTCFVRVEGEHCNLILDSIGVGGGWTEEPVGVPRAHADALLEACAGCTVFERSLVGLGQGPDAVVDHYTTPGTLDLISVRFQTNDEGSAFAAPVWFGPEVSDSAAFEGHALALEGVPSTPEVQPTNAALHGLLDWLEEFEPRRALTRYASSEWLSPEDSRVLEAMRRLGMSLGVAAPPEPLATPVLATDVPEPEGGMGDLIANLSQALGAATARGPDAGRDREKTGGDGAPSGQDLRSLPAQESA